MYGFLLLIHVIAATIWTGGHIVLSLVILPTVLKERSPEKLLAFEQKYERVGMPALLVQIVTGFLLAYRFLPNISSWLDMPNPLARGIFLKLLFLLLTFGLAIDAKLRVLPKLSDLNLFDMAWHVIGVTILSILFVAVGVSFRTGWLY